MHKKAFSAKLISVLALAAIITTLLASCTGGGGYYYDDSLAAGEEYTAIIENEFISADEENTSYFSIDANSAAYPNLRSLIKNGYEIPRDAIRIEEMLNYFRYDYTTAEGDDILALNASVFNNPYNSKTKLLTVGLAAAEVRMSDIRNNLVFLIDTSGSMESSDKLALIQSAFCLAAQNLNPEDRISIVTYAGNERVALDGAYGYQTERIKAVIDDLAAGGTTAGEAGIEKAYELARKYFIEGGNNRVILATDGDFNVGVTSTTELKDIISEKRESGIYFSVYGVGRGNLNSELMENLALSGNGTYSYLDSETEAKRAFVEGIGGSFITVAKDVKAGITFNTNYVDSYRLIGYENKTLTSEEFEDSETDAGELGSGHTVTVVYEIKLKGNEVSPEGKFADVIIKYKPSENTAAEESTEKSLTLEVGADVYRKVPNEDDLFVASVIEFALILRDSEYKAEANLDSLIARLDSLDLANYEDRAEFRELVKLYKSTYLD